MNGQQQTSNPIHSVLSFVVSASCVCAVPEKPLPNHAVNINAEEIDNRTLPDRVHSSDACDALSSAQSDSRSGITAIHNPPNGRAHHSSTPWTQSDRHHQTNNRVSQQNNTRWRTAVRCASEASTAIAAPLSARPRGTCGWLCRLLRHLAPQLSARWGVGSVQLLDLSQQLSTVILIVGIIERKQIRLYSKQ